jgi:hypothetical protein
MDAGGGVGKKHTFTREGSSKGVSQDDKVLHTTVFVSKYVSTMYKRINGTYLDLKRVLCSTPLFVTLFKLSLVMQKSGPTKTFLC